MGAKLKGWFLEYGVLTIFVPALVPIAVSFGGLWFFFGASSPKAFTPLAPRRPAAPSRMQVLCAIVLGITLLGFFGGPAIGAPTWSIAVGGAVLLVAWYTDFV